MVPRSTSQGAGALSGQPELVDSGNDSPFVAGARVYLCDNPGRQGTLTGKRKAVGSRVLVEIEFGPNDKQFKDRALLEITCSSHDPDELLKAGAFGHAADLRRVLIFEKIKGQLTNIFYSMESSNTTFYPHQFKPVLNFIESPVSRLLIADEVGLGKTIEAAYIWKEVQARHGARRLLVVCPAMLREKWRRDLRDKFNISGEIVTAGTLLTRLAEIAGTRTQEAFVYIVSLESIRAPSHYEDEEADKSARARLARLLHANPATSDSALFDQVIIDEAHYLRNPATGNNRIGGLLREAALHLVLLTATPIQLGSENLFQLMKLIDPDAFFDQRVFDGLIHANGSIIHAQRALWRQPPRIDDAQQALGRALTTAYFKDDAVIKRVQALLAAPTLTHDHRIEALRLLESRSLLSQYMTRSRKREVLEKRVERSPQTLKLDFLPEEKALYDSVSAQIRRRAEGRSGVHLFTLLARQRQMASSIVGALESWDDKGIIHELLAEDLGVLDEFGDKVDNPDPDIDAPQPVADIRHLERIDSKYKTLQDFISGTLTRYPTEKFVVFAFFKGTLRYLHRRLQADGVSSILLHGGGGLDKDEIVDTFARPDGPSVLLSSEIGSEGIDLQFCRFVVNYDLPWNPMKVEQRIGRLDRLGQTAERISIVNLKVENTIEDRIVMRLYERINVFRESIGDLEEILGDVTGQIARDLLQPGLSDAERERNAADTAMAIANTGAQQRKLEAEAVNLVGFSDYIMDNIRESRTQGRWLSAEELMSFVEDFFAKYFPNTEMKAAGEDRNCWMLLSAEAKAALGHFVQRTRPATHTRLHNAQRPVLCVFDPRKSSKIPSDAEFIDPSHPLIQWVRESYENDTQQIFPVSAFRVDGQEVKLPPGDYAYCVQRWAFKGLREENELAYTASHDRAFAGRGHLAAVGAPAVVAEGAKRRGRRRRRTRARQAYERAPGGGVRESTIRPTPRPAGRRWEWDTKACQPSGIGQRDQGAAALQGQPGRSSKTKGPSRSGAGNGRAGRERCGGEPARRDRRLLRLHTAYERILRTARTARHDLRSSRNTTTTSRSNLHRGR